VTTGQDGPFVPSLDTHPFGTPLREFEGVLQDYVPTKNTPPEGGREYMTIVFNFVDIVVIQSVEPYPFPIATLSISYSTSTETRWDALASSIKKLFESTPALEELVGKKQRWAYMPAKLRKRLDDGTWATVDDEAWQVASIGETSAGNPGMPAAEPGFDIDTHILNLLDGKTEQDFYQVFYQDPKVRTHPDLITAATERKLLSALEAAGRIQRDPQGIYHRMDAGTDAVPEPAPAEA